MDNKKKKQTKKKRVVLNTKTMGVDIDKNEYRGEIKASVQIRDIRFANTPEDKLFKSVELYEKFKRREKLTLQEAKFITPSREFLLGVFNFIKSYNVWSFDTETMLVRAKCPIEKYCTMQVSIDILCELGLIRKENESLIFEGNGKKVDLLDSKILRELNEQQGV